MKNPYIHRKMICLPESFFGRHRELERIYSLIESAQQVSVVGDRRIGKSSLLCCLALPEIQARYAHYDLSEHVFVYIDLLRCASYTPEDFLRYLLLELRKDTQKDFKIAIPVHNFSVEHFSDAIDKMMSLNKKVVFLLDEFDYVSRNKHLDLDFFNFLRSIANSRAVAFVTASTKSLLDLCDASVISSPFFNIFNLIKLGPFTQDEALEVIRIPSEQAGCSLIDQEKFILELTGRHPLLLQLACFLVFEASTSAGNAVLDQQAIRAMFEQQVHDHFKYSWEILENDEKLQIQEAATSGEFSLHPMLSSLPFREFVLHSPVLPVPVIKQSRRKRLMVYIRRLNRRSTRIIAGITVLIVLIGGALYLGFASGVQQLLLIPLAALVAWIVREMFKPRHNAQTPLIQQRNVPSADENNETGHPAP